MGYCEDKLPIESQKIPKEVLEWPFASEQAGPAVLMAALDTGEASVCLAGNCPGWEGCKGEGIKYLSRKRM